MKKLTILFLGLTLPIISYCQETIFNFDTLGIAKAKSIEQDLESKEFTVEYKVSVSKDYFSGAEIYKLEQPLMFVRSEKDFINDLEVEYFYTKNDGKVRLIVYNWDSKMNSREIKYDIEAKDINNNRIEVYNKKYEELLKYFTLTYGQPTEGTGELQTIKNAGYGKSKQRNAKWVTEKSIIELAMVWTDQNIDVGGEYKLVPTFRIRTKIYWK